MKTNKEKLLIGTSAATVLIGALSSIFASPAMASALTAASLLQKILPGTVMVVGPKGDVISYKKDGDVITIRQCLSPPNGYSPIESVESASGCAQQPGTADVTLSTNDFRTLALTQLQNQTVDHLKERQAQKFAKEFPNPADNGGIQVPAGSCKADPDFPDISNLGPSLDQLIAKMDRNKVNRKLVYSTDGQGIAFNLLKTIANISTCSTDKDANLAVGSVCQTKAASGDPVLWKISSDSHGNRLYTDTKSNITVVAGPSLDLKSHTDYFVATGKNFNETQAACQQLGYQAPSAGITNWSKDLTNPSNQTGQFAKLNADGIRNVIPDIQNHWFWSSLPYDYVGNAFYFSGGNSCIYIDDEGYFTDDGAVLCVAGR